MDLDTQRYLTHQQDFHEKFQVEDLDVGISNNFVFRHKTKLERFLQFGFVLFLVAVCVGVYGAIEGQKAQNESKKKELYNLMTIALAVGALLLCVLALVGSAYIYNMFKLITFALLATPNIREQL